MSEPMLIALLSSGVTLFTAVVTLIANAHIERFKSEQEQKNKKYEAKREHLNDVYKTLISIINIYPDVSPNDILNYVDYAPGYSMEYFEGVLKSLDYQIDDYEKQIKNRTLNYEEKYDVEIQISNRKYAIKKIVEIRDKYFKAVEKYKTFCETDKMMFDLYAGQSVRNCLVEFEVIIHNIFISGDKAGEEADYINNKIHVARRNLINSMRNDIGI